MEIISITDSDYIYNNDNFVIYGAGDIGRHTYKYLKKIGKNIVSFCDGDSSNWNKKLFGIEILSPQLCVEKFEDVTFVVANQLNYKSILAVLEDMEMEKVVLCNNKITISDLCTRTGKHFLEDRNYIYDHPVKYDLRYVINKVFYKAYAYCDWILHNRVKPSVVKNQKKYGVSLCLIFRNEAFYLKEWIEYHRIIGVDHFYLYDNNSADNYMEVLEPYIEEGIVDLIIWKVVPGQMAAYIDCAKRFRNESDWIGFIDTDEFIVPVETDNIKRFLCKFENRGSVLINWKCFGYNGKLERNKEGLVTEDFVQTSSKYFQLGKCFWNTKFAYRDDDPEDMMQIHYLRAKNKRGKLLPMVNCFGFVCNETYQFAMKEKFPIQINHYMHKSFREYCERKKNGMATSTEVSYRNTNQFYLDESSLDCADKKIFKYIGKLKMKMDIDRE